MITHRPARTLPPAVTALLAVLLAAVVVLVPARPAAAHDSLLSSDPADGAAVETLPPALTLSFSAALLSDAGSTVVEVTDASGASLTAGDPEVAENVVTQPLSGTASGTVTVLWRVVSSDGHPVSGDFAFTVTAPADPGPTPTATPEETTDAADSPSAEPTETPIVTTSADDAAVSPLPWIIGGVVAALVLGAVVALLAARARQGKDTETSRTAGRGPRDGR